MRRAYRFIVTVYIEAEDEYDLPPALEVAEHIATQVQDADDKDLDTCARLIETEDYLDEQQDTMGERDRVEDDIRVARRARK